MRIRIPAFLAAITALATMADAAEQWDPFTLPYDNPDLTFPSEPQTFAPGREIKMFKPDGPGPFPALVIMPGCYGMTYSMHTFDWAKRAIDHGYAVIVVDPLDPRGVSDNCVVPRPVPMSRLLKDAFNAGDHLRQQPFVDRSRIGLLGFSQGGMVGLGASGPAYSHLNGGEPFRAIVATYPVCILRDIETADRPGVRIDVRYAPDKVVVPLFLAIGDRDNRGGPDMMNGCKTLGDAQKALGAPVKYAVYHATHAWDNRELAVEEHSTNGYGQRVDYIHDADVTEQSAKDAFAFFDRQMKAQ